MPAAELLDRLARVARDQAYRNSLGEGAYVLDEAGRLLELNPAGERLLGWTAGELRGRDMHQAVHFLRPDGSPFPREACPLLGVLRSGEEFAETHDTFVRKDGTLLPVAYVSSPVLVGDAIVGAVLAFWSRPG
jgi:PAS domain S-box-containing protein